MKKGEPQFRLKGMPKAHRPKGPFLMYTGEPTEPKTTENQCIHLEDESGDEGREGLSWCGCRRVPWDRRRPIKKLTGKENLDYLVNVLRYCKRCLNAWMLHHGIIFR